MSEEPKKSIGGTINWLAPEILCGEAYEKAADIFSYGLILWELLTLKAPFSDLKNINPRTDRDKFKNYIKLKIQNNEKVIQIPKSGNIVLRCIASKCLMNKPEERISIDNIVNYLSRANNCYEEVDEAIIEMYHFVS